MRGDLCANARRELLKWDDTPIPRLYAAREMCSVFQLVHTSRTHSHNPLNLLSILFIGHIALKNN
jgi:hypothetical protein